MLNDIREYSSTDVILTFGGYVVEGWNKISVKRNIPSFKQIDGIRGKNTRVRNTNTSATMTISLAHTSPTNNIFQQIVAWDMVYGTGRIVLTLKDVLSGDVFETEEGYLEAPAQLSFEATSGERDWTVHCLSSEFKAGSGSNLGSLVERIGSIFNNL